MHPVCYQLGIKIDEFRAGSHAHPHIPISTLAQGRIETAYLCEQLALAQYRADASDHISTQQQVFEGSTTPVAAAHIQRRQILSDNSECAITEPAIAMFGQSC